MPADLHGMLISAASALALLLIGAQYFLRMERRFADDGLFARRFSLHRDSA